MTDNQHDLLVLLPDLSNGPSNGRYCFRGRKRTAESLVKHGWAADCGSSRYARTPEGRAAIAKSVFRSFFNGVNKP